MRRRFAAILTALAALVLAAPEGHAAEPCRVPDGATVQTRSSTTVVYATSFAVYGCLKGHRRMKIGELTPSTMSPLRLAHAAVNGRYAAAMTEAERYGCRHWHAASFDLRRRVQVHSAAVAATDCFEDLSAVRVDAMVVGRRGSIAVTRWKRTVEEVVRFRRGQRHDEILDSGAELDGRSLALRGTRLSWTNAGSTRFATLR